jgi:hypothetical protein
MDEAEAKEVEEDDRDDTATLAGFFLKGERLLINFQRHPATGGWGCDSPSAPMTDDWPFGRGGVGREWRGVWNCFCFV